MPELPEVETMRRGLLGIEGCEIEDVIFPRCRLRPISVVPTRGRFRKQLIGHTIVAIERLGKRVVLRLDNDYVVIFEPRMTGFVDCSAHDVPATLTATSAMACATADAIRFMRRSPSGGAGRTRTG